MKESVKYKMEDEKSEKIVCRYFKLCDKKFFEREEKKVNEITKFEIWGDWIKIRNIKRDG